MPWSSKQHRLFEGVAHGSIKPKAGLTKEKAAELASEGVKKDTTTEKRIKKLYKDKS